MKKKWMKKLVCLAAAVMMIGTSALAAVTTVDFQASFAAGRTPSIIASATLPRASSNGEIVFALPKNLSMYLGFYKGDWNRVTAEQTWNASKRNGTFTYYSTQSKGTRLYAYAGCDNPFQTYWARGEVTF